MSAPPHISDEFIDTFVNSKKKWITLKLEEFKNNSLIENTISFLDRKYIPFLGDNKNLYLQKKDNILKCKLTFKDNSFIANIPHNMSLENIDKELRNLAIISISNESSQIAKDRVIYFSKKLNLYPKKLQIKEQKSSWGTCSSLGNIYLNWRIFLAPMNIVDYVIVHELCHLKHMNHSPEFWNLVSSIIPNYKECKSWMNANGHKLNL